MKKILFFLLCAGWPSVTFSMLEQPSQNFEEIPLVFKIHQPFLREFIITKVISGLQKGKHYFEIYGKAQHGDPRNEHPILRNFIITISLNMLSPDRTFVESSISANGYIFYGLSPAKPADITIPFNYYDSNVDHLRLNNCVTQLLDLAFFYERGESQFCCEGCKETLWSWSLIYPNKIIQQHYTSGQGQLYCEKCAAFLEQCKIQFVDSSEISFDNELHISSRIEYAQSHGGVW